MRYCLLLLLLLCGSCTSGNQSSNANLIYSDTTYFQRLDTSFISANLTPKYALNRLNVVIPFLPLDTNLPVKNKAGKTIGKAKIKMEQNSEGTIDFDAEIEQDIDSVPKVTNFVKVAA